MVDVRIGDGRLLLEADAPSSVDLVVLDAFSSDAVPVHLITQEALGDALRSLRPDGMLLVHVSNRYYDLAPAIGAAAQRLGVSVLEREFEPDQAQRNADGAGLSDWMVLTRSPERVADFRAAGWVLPAILGPPADRRLPGPAAAPATGRLVASPAPSARREGATSWSSVVRPMRLTANGRSDGDALKRQAAVPTYSRCTRPSDGSPIADSVSSAYMPAP